MNGKKLLQWASDELGSEQRLEAELLLCHVLDTSRALLLAHDADELTAQQEKTFRQLILRRKQDEPLQYLLGIIIVMSLY